MHSEEPAFFVNENDADSEQMCIQNEFQNEMRHTRHSATRPYDTNRRNGTLCVLNTSSVYFYPHDERKLKMQKRQRFNVG